VREGVIDFTLFEQADACNTIAFAMPGLAWQCGLNKFCRSLRVGDFDNQFVLPFVLQFNHNRILWIVNIPENPLSVLIEGASRRHSGNVGAGHSDPVPPHALWPDLP
jgi:hypothetical protein